jgi:tetratricopeptide (TPR) repeat protein
MKRAKDGAAGRRSKQQFPAVQKYWAIGTSLLGKARAVCIDLCAIVGIGFVTWAIVLEVRRDTVEILPIDVPQALVESDLDSLAIAQRLLDHVRAVERKAKLAITQIALADQQSQPDIIVPGSGLSVRAIASQVRSILGYEDVRISGELVKTGDVLFIRLRTRGKGELGTTKRVAIPAFDDALEEAAQQVVREVEPFTWASYLYSTDPAAALVEVKRIVAELPPKNKNVAPAYSLWGVILTDQGEYDEAIDKFNKVLALDPDNAGVHNNLAATLFFKGDVDLALKHVRRALKLAPKMAEIQTSAGMILARKGMLEKAISSYERAIQIEPKFGPAYNNLGILLADSNRNEEAITIFKAGIDQAPQFGWLHCNLAIRYEKTGHFEEAADEFRKAIDVGTGSLQAAQHQYIFSQAQKMEGGVLITRKASTAIDQQMLARAYLGLGSILVRMGELDRAVVNFELAVKSSPSDAGSLITLASALNTAHRQAEALVIVKQALGIEPESPEAHGVLGDILRDSGQVDGAIAEYRNALKRNPDLGFLHAGLGIALGKKGLADQSIESFRKALELDPTDAETNSNLGLALAHKGKPDDAIASYKKALELNPNLAGVYFNLGLVYRDKGEKTEEIARYKQALEMDPEISEANFYLAIALVEQGKPAEAIPYYKRAIEIEPRNLSAYFNLAVAFDKAGRLDDAVAAYESLVARAPKFPTAEYHLGNAYLRKGEIDKAVNAFRAATESNPQDAQAFANLGTMLQAKGEGPAAEAAFRTAIEIDPKLEPAHFNLAVLLQALGRDDEALESYRRAAELDPAALELMHRNAFAQIKSEATGWQKLQNLRGVCRSLKVIYAIDPTYSDIGREVRFVAAELVPLGSDCRLDR